MKRLIFTTIFISLLSTATFAQIAAKNNHLYFHVGFVSGNVYSTAIPSLATWGLNELTHSNIFEGGFEYQMYKTNTDGQDIDVKSYDFMGIKAKDLFTNIHPNIKFGYQTQKMGMVNYGVYATAEYQLNRFRSQAENIDTWTDNKMQRALVGGSLFTVIGGMQNPYRFTLEAGCRYSIPISYEGAFGNDKNAINGGLSSHFAIKMSGSGALQDISIYADFDHYDVVKQDNFKIRTPRIGLTWTVTPGQNRRGRK